MEFIIDTCWLMFRQIQATAYILVEWFMSPIDPTIAELLEISIETTNIELAIGAIVPVTLFMMVFSFIKSALTPL